MSEALQDLGELISAAQPDAIISANVSNDELTLQSTVSGMRVL